MTTRKLDVVELDINLTIVSENHLSKMIDKFDL